MGLMNESRAQRKIRYIICCSLRDIELDYESDINEFRPKNRGESF